MLAPWIIGPDVKPIPPIPTRCRPLDFPDLAPLGAAETALLPILQIQTTLAHFVRPIPRQQHRVPLDVQLLQARLAPHTPRLVRVNVRHVDLLPRKVPPVPDPEAHEARQHGARGEVELDVGAPRVGVPPQEQLVGEAVALVERDHLRGLHLAVHPLADHPEVDGVVAVEVPCDAEHDLGQQLLERREGVPGVPELEVADCHNDADAVVAQDGDPAAALGLVGEEAAPVAEDVPLAAELDGCEVPVEIDRHCALDADARHGGGLVAALAGLEFVAGLAAGEEVLGPHAGAVIALARQRGPAGGILGSRRQWRKGPSIGGSNLLRDLRLDAPVGQPPSSPP